MVGSTIDSHGPDIGHRQTDFLEICLDVSSAIAATELKNGDALPGAVDTAGKL
jgi:hypothetical protein